MPILARCVSERYFKKVKDILDVESKEELFDISKNKIRNDPFLRVQFEYDLPSISWIFSEDKIAKLP